MINLLDYKQQSLKRLQQEKRWGWLQIFVIRNRIGMPASFCSINSVASIICLSQRVIYWLGWYYRMAITMDSQISWSSCLKRLQGTVKNSHLFHKGILHSQVWRKSAVHLSQSQKLLKEKRRLLLFFKKNCGSGDYDTIAVKPQTQPHYVEAESPAHMCLSVISPTKYNGTELSDTKSK